MAEINGDTYTHGGMPQSRYCGGCAHYRALYDSMPKASAKVCLYILDDGRPRGCPAGQGCTKHATPAQWAQTARGRESERARAKSAARGAKNRGRKKEST